MMPADAQRQALDLMLATANMVGTVAEMAGLLHLALADVALGRPKMAQQRLPQLHKKLGELVAQQTAMMRATGRLRDAEAARVGVANQNC